jgi:hypothetical protein
MGYAINPLSCVSFGGSKSGKKRAAKKPKPAPAPAPVATTDQATAGNQSAAKKSEPTPAPAATTDQATAGNQSAAAASTIVGAKRAKAAADKRRKAEAAPYRGGFMPYRPLYSYNIDPVANCMYFWGSVGQIMC